MENSTAASQEIRKRALIVDDNNLSRRMLQYYLAALNCDWTEANDGQETLLHLQKASYDLIILDWHMPNLNGYDTLVSGDKILSHFGPRPQIPVLIYTSVELRDLQIPHCNRLSVRATLSKKWSPALQQKYLRRAIETLLRPTLQK